jgi:FdhD protein
MPDEATPPAPAGAAARTLGSGQRDLLVHEAPLLLIVHGQQLLTMRTPGQEADLALGFLLGEGIVHTSADVQSVAFRAGDVQAQRTDEVLITLTTAPDASVRGKLARTHEIRSSCGICGLADPQQILEGTPPLLPGVPKISPGLVATLLASLQQHQPLFAATGGCHGALIAAADGSIHGHGEDIGRHNALDKAIGMAARSGADLARSIAVLSGRAGYDLVVKCLRVRIPIIISVSAPSSLAFDLCSAAGATLLGFARGTQAKVYCGGERVAS